MFEPKNIDSAIKGLDAVVRNLRTLVNQYGVEAVDKRAEAEALKLQAGEADRNKDRAARIANKIEELLS